MKLRRRIAYWMFKRSRVRMEQVGVVFPDWKLMHASPTVFQRAWLGVLLWLGKGPW